VLRDDQPNIQSMMQTTATSRVVSLVDDDAGVRKSLSNLLNSAGWTVEPFASAEEYLSSGRTVARCCLILDIKLPHMSGIELQELLLSRADPIPVIFITANAANNLRIQALRNGALAFFYKPFNAETLLTFVHMAVARAEITLADCQ
jgi:two-component system, LuxR family, response regulator FixJ